jgi:tetratricopeptide (TPR) repeat protein
VGGHDVSDVAIAEEALALVRVDRAEARAACERILGTGPEPSPEAASVAARALALVEVQEGRPLVAFDHVARAVDHARAAGSRQREAEARLTAVGVLGVLGRLGEAEEEAARTHALTDDPALRVRIEIQLASVYRLADRHREAVARLDRALVVPGADDAFTTAVLLHNRGTAHLQLGQLDQARADLARAADAYGDLGQHEMRHASLVHLARVAALQGDIPSALGLVEMLREAKDTSPDGLYDLAQCFLDARLFTDARAAARAAADRCTAEHLSLLPTVLLCLAEAELGDGDLVQATEIAERAADVADEADLTDVAVAARVIALAAAWNDGTPAGALVEPASALAQRAARLDLSTPVVDACVLAGRILLDAGRRPAAEPVLRRLVELRHSPILQRRTAARLAQASLAADDHPGPAGRMLTAAMRDIDTYAAALSSAELHTSSATAGVPVAALGLRLARRSGHARRLYLWSEWSRAAVFRLAPVTPPQDPERQRLLTELRTLSSTEDSGHDDRLVRRQGRLERALRERALLDTSGRFRPLRPPSPAALLAALGDRILVEWVVIDGVVVAVTAGGGRFGAVEVGAAADLTALVLDAERARRTQTSMVGEGTDPMPAVDVARDYERLDRALFGPVRRRVGDRAVVVVPPPEMLAVPWADLPSLHARPFAVAPSATLWVRAEERFAGARSLRPSNLLAVAGPRLAHADDDVRAVGRRYESGPTTLVGAEATVPATLAALTEVDVVHLAAHGEFRPDNPLLSAIELFDGPLTAHDLELAERVPRLWVLAACEVGRFSPRRAREVLGFASALLQFGAATVVAATGPVLDEVMPEFSGAVHGRLAAGEPPAEALAGLRRDGAGDERARLTTSAFVCLGALGGRLRSAG